MHADECFLRHFHCQVVIEKEFVAEVVDALVPELHQLALGVLVPFAGTGDQGIGMHHGNVEEGFGHKI